MLILDADPDFPDLAALCSGFLTADIKRRIVAIGPPARTGAPTRVGAVNSTWRKVFEQNIAGHNLEGRITCIPATEESLIAALSAQSTVFESLTSQGAEECRLEGGSEAISRVRELICAYAQTDLPVLILGETGSGKEIAARSIHLGSSRRCEPLIPLDCGAAPATLVESMIFGSEKGAYTDAISRVGAIEEAKNGTLFLDEIGNLPLQAQGSLLRVLETGDYRRLGSTRTRRASMRLICATSMSMAEGIRERKFRQDLYYRINTLVLQIPALRDRPEDIAPIATSLCLKHSRGRCTISREAMDCLLAYAWPGNIRELRNTIQRAIVLKGDSGEIRREEIHFL